MEYSVRSLLCSRYNHKEAEVDINWQGRSRPEPDVTLQVTKIFDVPLRAAAGPYSWCFENFEQGKAAPEVFSGTASMGCDAGT